MTSRPAVLTALAAVLLLGTGLSACAGGSTDSGSSATTGTPSGDPAVTTTNPSTTAAIPPAAPGTVEVRLFQFQPSPATVTVGETVTFVNRDDTTHTATAGSPEAPTGSFDLRLAGPGASATFTPTTPGTYTYYCAIHESMRGELVVTG